MGSSDARGLQQAACLGETRAGREAPGKLRAIEATFARLDSAPRLRLAGDQHRWRGDGEWL
jgi:hypothetical protein